MEAKVKEKLYVVRFIARANLREVEYNVSSAVSSICFEMAKRYTKRELDEAIYNGETYCNGSWMKEFVVLDEWR